MCKCCSPKVAFIVRVIYASIGILIGLIICAVFYKVFDNVAASIFGLISAIFAAVCLAQFIYLYVRVVVCKARPQVPVLCVFGIIGAVGIGVGLGGLATFLGFGIHESVTHTGESLPKSPYIVCVWGFSVFKWGLVAFVYALRNLHKIVRNQFQPLIEEIEETDHMPQADPTTIQS